jgi:hypothetical protein
VSPSLPWTSIYPDGQGTVAGGGDGAAALAENPGPFPDLPAGAIPFDRDLTIAAASTTTIFDPGVGQKFYLVSAFVSTDTAMRVAIVDETDVQNSRPVDGYFGANGGASPNLVPKWYDSKVAGNRLRVVTGALGNVKVRVSGFTLTA